nr:tripartite tricarboxylate transporter substrate binding protein [Pseudomonas sp.]
MTLKRTLISACLALATVLPGGAALAKSYPDKQITLVVPFPPGGLTDLIGRRFAHYLEQQTGQTVVVENRAGASGQVGAQYVARQEADGHTLLVTATHFALSQALRKDLPYNAIDDFTPVAMFVTSPNMLVVRSDSKINSIQDYIKASKEQDGGISFGSSGAGGSTHLSGELLKFKTGADITHVPYKGMVLQVNDLIGGQLESGFVDPSSVMQFLETGRLKVLGVTSPERVSILPDIPTIREQGVDGYEAQTWIALLGPAGMPEAITNSLNQWAVESMQTPESQEYLKGIGNQASTLGPEEFRERLHQEIAKWTDVAEKARIRE